MQGLYKKTIKPPPSFFSPHQNLAIQTKFTEKTPVRNWADHI